MTDNSTFFDVDYNKLNTELMLALDTSEELREESLDLNVGFDSAFQVWNLIVRYTGNLREIADAIGFDAVELLQQYGIVRIREERINQLLRHPQILYIEKPKRLFEERLLNLKDLQASCLTNLNQSTEDGSGGENLNASVLVAVIDSGIDIFHPQFIRNNRTIIEAFWDQNQSGNPPLLYGFGTEYTEEDINSYLQDSLARSPGSAFDSSGHGTAVSGIIVDIVENTKLLVVGIQENTLALLCGVDYAVRYALSRNLPLVINLSYGNNYGNHRGDSLLENYLDAVASMGKISIVTGMGNDGASSRHKEYQLVQNQRDYRTEISVLPGLQAFNLQVWFPYTRRFGLTLRTPGNTSYTIDALMLDTEGTRYRYQYGETTILIQIGSPSPLNQQMEIFLSLSSSGSSIQAGIWEVVLTIRDSVYGNIHLWLPVAASTSADVFFDEPSTDVTFTIPASASRIISVGAYDTSGFGVAPFSGRGFTADGRVKPDLVAPGVNIQVARVGGGTITVSGTSFAVPFVSASAALLMDWGIRQGNDPFLYGEKLRAYLIAGAKPLPGYQVYPNPSVGYGALCYRNSLS